MHSYSICPTPVKVKVRAPVYNGIPGVIVYYYADINYVHFSAAVYVPYYYSQGFLNGKSKKHRKKNNKNRALYIIHWFNYECSPYRFQLINGLNFMRRLFAFK